MKNRIYEVSLKFGTPLGNESEKKFVLPLINSPKIEFKKTSSELRSKIGSTNAYSKLSSYSLNSSLGMATQKDELTS